MKIGSENPLEFINLKPDAKVLAAQRARVDATKMFGGSGPVPGINSAIKTQVQENAANLTVDNQGNVTAKTGSRLKNDSTTTHPTPDPAFPLKELDKKLKAGSVDLRA